MVEEGDPCPTCKEGTMSFRGHRHNEGEFGGQEPYQGIGEETGYVCNKCGTKWNPVTRVFTHRYKIESRNSKKQDEKRKGDSKGGMKKMKNTAQPRRQSPR